MNFRQIQLLNDLEVKVASLEKEVIRLNEKLGLLENPPKRKPGRPKKVVDDYKVLDSLRLGSR